TRQRHLDSLRWGLVPFNTADLRAARKPINARSETVATSPMFRAAFAKRRCLVPAAAFYEWRTAASGKEPFAIARADGEPLAFAGIWEGWRSPDGEVLRTFAILTTTANRELSGIHDLICTTAVKLSFRERPIPLALALPGLSWFGYAPAWLPGRRPRHPSHVVVLRRAGEACPPRSLAGAAVGSCPRGVASSVCRRARAGSPCHRAGSNPRAPFGDGESAAQTRPTRLRSALDTRGAAGAPVYARGGPGTGERPLPRTLPRSPSSYSGRRGPAAWRQCGAAGRC
ncbi:MAG: SOS response-associated peptidase, partial [Acetobacteraceae bacterium]|nr:SOS response-associated peptidase [Acetobacteraceae bacterium]